MTTYSTPPDKQTYHAQVWAIVRDIPAGKVATYGQIAQMIPVPEGIEDGDYKAFSPRWVGEAMAASPQGVPWQRVINSQGKISQLVDADKQRDLLEKEGLVFLRGRIDLASYQWGNPDAENGPSQGALF